MNATAAGTTDDVSCTSSSVASSEESGADNNDMFDDDMFDTQPLKRAIGNNTRNNSPSVTIKAPVAKKRMRSTENSAGSLLNNFQASSPRPPAVNKFTPPINATAAGTMDDASCTSSSVASSEESGADNNDDDMFDDDIFDTQPLKRAIGNNTRNDSSSVTIKAPDAKIRMRSAENSAGSLFNNSQASSPR